MAELTDAQVRHIAHLARLSLGEGEVAELRAELKTILTYMSNLDAIDLGLVEPASGSDGSPLRDDVVSPGLARAEVLAAAPSVRAGGFSVPRVLDVEGVDDIDR